MFYFVMDVTCTFRNRWLSSWNVIKYSV